jgi:hypothetical protein
MALPDGVVLAGVRIKVAAVCHPMRQEAVLPMVENGKPAMSVQKVFPVGGVMLVSDSEIRPTLGFLTVVEHPDYGLFGGYLILNTAGRPLEFHCTAPIKPNRAQQILYGPTLESFLYGEQIGQTLIGNGSKPPLVVCTDREPALAAREYVA